MRDTRQCWIASCFVRPYFIRRCSDQCGDLQGQDAAPGARRPLVHGRSRRRGAVRECYLRFLTVRLATLRAGALRAGAFLRRAASLAVTFLRTAALRAVAFFRTAALR